MFLHSHRTLLPVMFERLYQLEGFYEVLLVFEGLGDFQRNKYAPLKCI